MLFLCWQWNKLKFCCRVASFFSLVQCFVAGHRSCSGKEIRQARRCHNLRLVFGNVVLQVYVFPDYCHSGISRLNMCLQEVDEFMGVIYIHFCRANLALQINKNMYLQIVVQWQLLWNPLSIPPNVCFYNLKTVDFTFEGWFEFWMQWWVKYVTV